MALKIRSCPVLTEKAAEEFLKKIAENEKNPVKIDLSKEIKKVEKILKNARMM